MKILALIAARSGSKGLRHKNVRPLRGLTLLERAVALAHASRRANESWSVIVSTDSTRYASMARRAGAEVPFLRPRHLASDTARLIDVVHHALETLARAARRFDAVVLLSATTPLTQVRDVRAALRLWRSARGGASVASVTREQVAESWRFALARGRLLAMSDEPPGRRQKSAPRYVLNGAIYVASPAWLARHGRFVVSGRTLPHIMPKERSLDIDDPIDWAIAEALLQLSRKPE